MRGGLPWVRVDTCGLVMSGYPGGGSSINEGGGPPLHGASNEATRRWAALLAAQFQEDGLVRLPNAPASLLFSILCEKLRVPLRYFLLYSAPRGGALLNASGSGPRAKGEVSVVLAAAFWSK